MIIFYEEFLQEGQNHKQREQLTTFVCQLLSLFMMILRYTHWRN